MLSTKKLQLLVIAAVGLAPMVLSSFDALAARPVSAEEAWNGGSTSKRRPSVSVRAEEAADRARQRADKAQAQRNGLFPIQRDTLRDDDDSGVIERVHLVPQSSGNPTRRNVPDTGGPALAESDWYFDPMTGKRTILPSTLRRKSNRQLAQIVADRQLSARLREVANEILRRRGYYSRSSNSKSAKSDAKKNGVSEKALKGAMLGKRSTIAPGDFSKYVKGFSAQIYKSPSNQTTELRLFGLVHPDCANNLAISLSRPDENLPDGIGKYALKFETGDLINERTKEAIEGGDLATACDQARTDNCTRETCVDIQNVPGVRGDMVNFAESGKVLVLTEDKGKSEGDPSSMKWHDLLARQQIGLMEYLSDADAQKIQKEKTRLALNEKVASLCEAAKKGDRDSIEELRDLMEEFAAGIGKVADNIEEIFAKFEITADEEQLEGFEKRIADASSISDLNDLIDEVKDFASAHDEHGDMKKRAVSLLKDIAIAAPTLEGEDGAHGYEMPAKLKLAERALGAAKKLDRKDKGLRLAYETAKLERYKASAESGSDQFYNSITRKEANASFKNVYSWARQSRDPQVRQLFTNYSQQLAPRSFYSTLTNQFGQQLIIPQMGTGLDQKFSEARTQNASSYQSLDPLMSIGDEFNAYRSGGVTF